MEYMVQGIQAMQMERGVISNQGGHFDGGSFELVKRGSFEITESY